MIKKGTIIGDRYEVIRQIGRGGSSEVYLVKHIYLDTEFALKVSPLSQLKRRDDAIEAHILKDLRHPQLPRIIDIFQDDKYSYIVRDYIEGSDLRQHIDRHGPQPIDKTVDYAVQIIDVLRYLHGRAEPLIYRDLKPSNIIISRTQRLILIDFGTTRTYNPTRDEDTVYLGTKGYAPPELFGGSQSDQRTDIYSLGATLYYIYTADHWMEVAAAEKFRKFNGVVANHLRAVIEKAMQLSAAKRYQTVDELKDDLIARGLYKGTNRPLSTSQTGHHQANKLIVGVMGLTRGCGCTHQALAIAKYCAKRLAKTVFIQRVAGADLTLLESYSNGRSVGQGSLNSSFKLSGIHFMQDVKDDQFNDLITKRDINLVIDYATNYHLLNDFLKAHKKIVVLPKSAWALANYQRIFELLKYQDVDFIVNLASEDNCADLADWLQIDRRRLHASGYIADPLVGGEGDSLYQSLIGVGKQRHRFKFWGGNR